MNRGRERAAWLAVAALAGLTACSGSGSLARGVAEPGPDRVAEPSSDRAEANPSEASTLSASWIESSPESVGMSSDTLAGLFDFVAETGLPIHGLTLVRYGQIVLDANFYPSAAAEPHDIASCTKSVTSTLYGIALGAGLAPGTDALVTRSLGLPERPDDVAWSTMTVGDLLTMRSGLENDESVDLWRLRESADWAAFALSLPGADVPGTRFNYTSANSHLLAAILERSTGQPLAEFARERLFDPLGIGAVEWPRAPEGTAWGAGDVRMHRRDLARIGLLYLRRGEWNGERIVSEAWIEEATHPHVDLPDEIAGIDNGYGYQWWTYGGGTFAAQGRGQQYLVVDPTHDLVAVVTAGASSDDVAGFAALWTEFVLPSILSDRPLADDPTSQRLLASRVRRAAAPPAAAEASERPRAAVDVHGVRWLFDPNRLGLVTMTLDVLDPVGELELRWAQGALRVPLGFAGVPLVAASDAAPEGLPIRPPVAARARWLDDETLEIELDLLAEIDRWLLVARFDGDTVLVTVEELTFDVPGYTLTGRVDRGRR